MAFSLDTADFPTISNFDQAEAQWASRKAWRNEPSSHRPLEKKTKKHCRLIRVSADEYVARLHDTAVVTYLRDGIKVNATYGSISTDNFVQALLRRSLNLVTGNRGYPVAWEINRPGEAFFRNGRLIDGREAIFDTSGKLLNPKPYVRPTINRKKSKRVRDQYGVDDFRTWRRAYESMNPDAARHPDHRNWYGPRWRPDRLTTPDVIDLLRQRGDDWIDLAMQCTDEHIVDCVYRQHPEIIDKVEYETFANMADYDNWLKLDSKYGWAVR